MQRFEAPTLEEAYAEAAKAFSCSVTQLHIEVIQHPSKGFLGFGKKNAIIVVARAQSEQKPKRVVRPSEKVKEKTPRTRSFESARTETPQQEEKVRQDGDRKVRSQEQIDIDAIVEEVLADSDRKHAALEVDQEIFDNFYQEKPDIREVSAEIERHLRRMFDEACFEIDTIEVGPWDEETLLVEFGGNDAALLIGKEGYRYKALAHLLYNWIHGKYGYKVRLEIAEFLQNQETMIDNYLQTIVQRIENEGRGQTKVLDGILVQIALKRLRELFPDKYVAVRSNKEGGRYVIVNEFMERR